MKKSSPRIMSLFLSLILVATVALSACAPKTEEAPPADDPTAAAGQTADVSNTNIPKYVFLFIGDGMSFPQLSALGFYKGTVENDFTGTLKEPTPDNQPVADMPKFTEFPVVGSSTTYDASKFVTDSASAATAIASGVKTLDGVIGQDAFGTDVPTIAEIMHGAGYKAGVISNVSLDHATPAAFYAHQASRSKYYDISLDMINSGFEFFGGGGFFFPNGYDDEQEKSIFDLAEEAGYKVANTKADILAISASDEKVLAVNEVLDAASDIHYRIDLDNIEDADKSLALADFVKKGIEVLDNDKGFFLMCESGKIDWAGHANDAMANIQEIIVLEEAVQVALDFAQQHPDDTLIIVTGDHETGGFSNGYGGTEYDTYFSVLSAQKVSSAWFESNIVPDFIPNNATYEDVMDQVKEYFGLVREDDPDSAALENPALIITPVEEKLFRAAYEQQMIPASERDLADEEYRRLYGTVRAEPIVITATHVLNNKAGIGWSTTSHSALPTAVFAYGAGADVFNGMYDNTDIPKKIKELVGL